MKKYWKSAAVIAGIVLSIGTFYVNSATSAQQYPEFVIKTKGGDAEEIKPLVLEGAYTETSSMDYVSTNVKITANGSTYNTRSFLNQVIGHSPTVIKELQEEYRSFMRGKNSSVNSFFENDEFLAYADVDYKMGSLKSSNFMFQLSMFNKEDGHINSFAMEVPDSDELDYAHVEDVQLVEDTLYIVTQNMMRNNNDFFNEKHIYSIDISTQKISDHEAIIQVPDNHMETQIDVRLFGTNSIKPSEHLIIFKREIEVIEEAESIREEVKNQDIISYNIATKKQEKVTAPGLDLEENQLSFSDGSIIYFTKLEGQEFVVTPYSIVDKKVGKEISIQLSNKNGDSPVPMITVEDGKLYVVSSHMNSKFNGDVIVVDVKTGKTLFEGQIGLEDSSEELKDMELYMHDLYVK